MGRACRWTPSRGHPAHLQALIEHQLAQLSPEDQQLLEAASVGWWNLRPRRWRRDWSALRRRWRRGARRWPQGQFLQAHGPAAWPDGTVTEGMAFAMLCIRRWCISGSRLAVRAAGMPGSGHAWRRALGRPGTWRRRWRCIACVAACCRRRCRIYGRQASTRRGGCLSGGGGLL